MTNTVAITIKANGPSGSAWAAIKADAAKAGASAADAFNEAFKSKADARGTATERLKESGGVGGEDASLMNRLKGYANTPGGIGILGTGNDTSLMSMLKNQIRQMGESGGPGLLSGMSQGGGQSTTDMVRQVLTNSVTGNTTSNDFIKQILQGTGPSNTNTTDIIKQVLQGATPGNISTEDIIRRVVEGQLPGNMDTTDTIHEKIDDSAIKDQGTKDGATYGASFASSLKNKLSGLLGGGGGAAGGGVGSLLTGGGSGGSDAGGVASALDSGGVAGGALPGMAGVSGMAATVTGLAGALVAVLPAITAVASGLGAIGGGFAILLETSKSFKSEMTSDMGDIEKVFGDAAAPLAKPLEQAATQIVGYFKAIEPDLKMVFADSGSLVQPLVKGFEALMSGAGPGFLAMIKSAGPVFATVGQAFANLGKSLGTMFSDFASDGAGSATILKSFLDIINSLLPFIGELGKIMVSALAPAFSAFSGALSGLLPALSPLMSILGSFAGAVLSDLGSVLGAVGQLLVGLAPSFTLLAKVAANLFNTLENTGVFAILGDSLESLAGPIANLVNALVKGLAPALPGIVSVIGSMSSAIATLVASGLGVLVNLLADVVKWLTPILPLLLDAVIAWKALTVAVGLFNTVMDFNPFAAIALAIVAVTGLIIKYHTQILSFIEQTWNTVYSFIKGIWNDILSFAEQWWPLLLGPAGLIVKYHNDVYDSIKNVWNDILSWLKGIWNDISSAASSAWHAIESTATAAWDDVFSGVKTAWGAILSWFQGLPGKVLTALGALGGDLLSFGKSVIGDLWNGLKDAWSSVVSWFEKIPGDILSALGIHSPPDWAISAGKDIMTGIAQGAEAKANVAIAAAEKAAAKMQAAAKAPGGALNPGSNSGNEALMKQMAAARGWTGALWTDLYNVEMREAGFSMTAQNPNSDAYGMAQFINGPSEYYQYGGNPNTAAGQITGMLNYIADTYGTPAGAWQSELTRGFYASGGATPAGWAMVGELGRELVKLPGGSTVYPHGASNAMVAGGAGVPAVVQLEVSSAGSTAFEQFMVKAFREWVRVKGGGNVQAAFGRN